MKRIAIVGCGVVGASWALVFIRAGLDVALYDASPDMQHDAVDFVTASLLGAGASEMHGSLRTTGTLEEALAGADYIQESLPERIEVKRDIFRRLDECASPGAIIASSSSGYPASSFTAPLAGRSRCLVVNPINPSHLIALVEIVPAPWTTADTVARCADLMREIGQAPIVLAKEISGFVVNRLEGALLAEAFALVEEGVCDSADIDRAVSEGLGLRWFFMGPFETIDLNAKTGLAEYCRHLGPMFFGLAIDQADPHLWTDQLVAHIETQRRQLVSSADLESRRVWRNRTLASLLAAKQRIVAASP